MAPVVAGRLPAQLLEHEGLHQQAKRHSVAVQVFGAEVEQRTGEAGIHKVQFGRLHQAALAVAVPGRESLEQEHPLQQREVVVDGWPAEAEGGTEFCDVQQPRGLHGGDCQQAGQHLQGTDARQLVDVPLHKRVDVVPAPVRPSPAGLPRQRRRIAPGDDAFGQRHAQARVAARREVPGEQRVQKSRRLALQLRLRQRVQPHDVHAPGQRIRELRHGEHMRRAGEQKTPRHAALVHRALQRQE